MHMYVHLPKFLQYKAQLISVFLTLKKLLLPLHYLS